jgi:hypothetical protein
MEKDKCIQSFCWNYEGKGHLGRPRTRWDDNSKIDLKEVGWDSVDWLKIATSDGLL